MKRYRIAYKRRVLLNLKSGRALRGLLWRETGGLIVLREATLFEVGAPPASIDGEVLIPIDEVDFAQVLPPATTAAIAVRGVDAELAG